MTKIKKTFLVSFALVLFMVFAPVSSTMAADPPTPGNCPSAAAPSGLTFFPAWYDGLMCGNGNLKSPGDPSLGGDTGQRFGTWLSIIAMNIVRMLLYVVGYASLIFIIWGGFKYMTQGDNSNGTAAARKTIQNAVIGLIISIASVSIVTFIVQRISA